MIHLNYCHSKDFLNCNTDLPFPVLKLDDSHGSYNKILSQVYRQLIKPITTQFHYHPSCSTCFHHPYFFVFCNHINSFSSCSDIYHYICILTLILSYHLNKFLNPPNNTYFCSILLGTFLKALTTKSSSYFWTVKAICTS